MLGRPLLSDTNILTFVVHGTSYLIASLKKMGSPVFSKYINNNECIEQTNKHEVSQQKKFKNGFHRSRRGPQRISAGALSQKC